jgi:hypothetical protein
LLIIHPGSTDFATTAMGENNVFTDQTVVGIVTVNKLKN